MKYGILPMVVSAYPLTRMNKRFEDQDSLANIAVIDDTTSISSIDKLFPIDTPLEDAYKELQSMKTEELFSGQADPLQRSDGWKEVQPFSHTSLDTQHTQSKPLLSASQRGSKASVNTKKEVSPHTQSNATVSLSPEDIRRFIDEFEHKDDVIVDQSTDQIAKEEQVKEDARIAAILDAYEMSEFAQAGYSATLGNPAGSNAVERMSKSINEKMSNIDKHILLLERKSEEAKKIEEALLKEIKEEQEKRRFQAKMHKLSQTEQWSSGDQLTAQEILAIQQNLSKPDFNLPKRGLTFGSFAQFFVWDGWVGLIYRLPLYVFTNNPFTQSVIGIFNALRSWRG